MKLRSIAALIGLSFAATCAAPLPAFAQGNNCAPREVVIARLAEKYGEARQSIGMGQQGMVMETFANHSTGSWTITVTLPTGMTCLMASGQSYEALDESVVEGDPT